MYGFFDNRIDWALKNTKEALVIVGNIQIFNYLHRQGLHKRQKKLQLSGSLYRVLI